MLKNGKIWLDYFFLKNGYEKVRMEKVIDKDGSISLIFQNEMEYRHFMFYYSIGKDITRLQGSDTNVLP